MKLIEHFVGGKIISGKSKKKGKVFNPATGEQEKEVKLASKEDLDQAVAVAQFGPFKLLKIDTYPAAIFGTIEGTKNGETLEGPLSL